MDMHKLAHYYYSLGNLEKNAAPSKATIGAILAPLAASPLVREAPSSGFPTSLFDSVMSGYANQAMKVLPDSLGPAASILGIGAVSALGAGLGKAVDIASKARLRESALNRIESAALEALQRDAVRNAMPSPRNVALAGLLAGGALGAGGGYIMSRRNR